MDFIEANFWWIIGGGALVLLLAVRWLWHLARATQIERARELFRLQHERFEQMLLTAAAATGKPRGLVWTRCEIIGDAMLARDVSRGIVALVPVVLQFEPEADSDMENVPAAREPRPATALFIFHRGHWHTDGRVIFNLNPGQALTQLHQQLQPITHH